MADKDKDKDVVKADQGATVSPAEFAKIPLDFIIATPLLTTIQAHRLAAETTLDFVKNILPSASTNVEMKMKVRQKKADGTDDEVEKTISVPLITLVKVPSLTFDSLSVSFNYNISQIYNEKESSAQSLKLDIGTKGLLKGLLNASLTGSVDHSRTRENTANRGGSLEVKLHVSESALPAGLQKIIDALVENINVPTSPNA